LKGGLRVLELKNLNKTLLGKWKWRLGTKENNLWKEILESKYDLGEYWMDVLRDQMNLVGGKILGKCAGKAWKECFLMKNTE